MQLSVYNTLVVPPSYAWHYLVAFPASRVTYYSILPFRTLYWAIASSLEFIFDLAGSYAAVLKLFTVAALVGAVTGWVLHRVSKGASNTLGITSALSFEQEVKPQRSLADYRRQRRQKRQRMQDEVEREAEAALQHAPWMADLDVTSSDA